MPELQDGLSLKELLWSLLKTMGDVTLAFSVFGNYGLLPHYNSSGSGLNYLDGDCLIP